MELPFADKVDAILNMYLPGQNGGEATFSLLFGESSPSGRLAETWPLEYADVPFGDTFGKSQNEVYKESIFVGYRYYTTAGKKVRYPFGYGLSYTSFAYENMTVEENEAEFRIGCDITNIGNCDGAEVVQLYASKDESCVFRPIRELKGFSKVYLKAGECKHVQITVNKEDLRYWNTKEDRYVLEHGEYRFELCSDCETVKLSKAVEIKGEVTDCPYSSDVLKIYRNTEVDKITDCIFEQMSGVKIPAIPPKKPIRLESRFSDMKATFMGKILYAAVLSVAKSDMRKAKKMPEGVERDNKIKGAIFLRRILDSNSIITMSMSAGSSCPYNMAEMFVNLANGKIIKGLGNLCSGIKAPPLPKDKENKNGK
jgi:beta-glucosidase